MNTQFTIDVRAVQRIICVIVAALLVAAGLPLLQAQPASADQFANRSIQMSDTGPSGGTITSGVGSGTNVTYRVTFTPTNQAASMVIDFCSNDPIVNDTCNAPTAMAAATGITNVSGTAGNSDWVLTAGATQVKIARTGGTSTSDIQSSVPQVFDITGVTNPSTVGSFYARMYTFTDDSWGTYSSATSVGNYVDYGGTALSITEAITITARVQESLTFCVTSADPTTWITNHDCSDSQVGSNPPAVILGHGSPTAVLDSNTVDTGTIYSQMSTNATHGAIINLRNSNTSCGGLSADGGTTCAIPAINSGSATPSAMTAGTAAFGLFVATGAADSSGGIGSTTAASAYHDNAHTTVPSDVYYGMDTTSSSATPSNGVPSTYTGSVTSTFGSTVAYTTSPVYRVNNAYTFAATSALTTPAGIYTANLSMIATGTF